MAQQTPPNNQQNIDQLHSIQQNLFGIADSYREWNKLAQSNNKETLTNLSLNTELGKLVNKSLDIRSKIGKELLNQKTISRTIEEIHSKSNRLQSDYESTLRSLTSYQKQQVELLGKQEDQMRSLVKQSDQLESSQYELNKEREASYLRLDALDKQGLLNSKEALDLFDKIDVADKELLKTSISRKNVEQSILSVNENITKAYKSQNVASALFKQQQAREAKDLYKTTQSLPKAVEQGNKILRKGSFWKEAFSRVPILDQFSKAPELIEKFGKGGILALGVIGALGAGLAKIVELMFKGDKQITDIQKGFSVTREQAEAIRQSFYEISANAGKFADIQKGTLINEEDIFQAQLEFNKAFGTAIVMSGQQLTQFAKIKDIIGLSEEAMKGLSTYSLGSGKSLENIDRTVLGTSRQLQIQAGIQLNNKQILEDVYKVTGGIRANFKGNVQELTKAVTQAKLYGTSLDQIQHTSDSLLDFESSIENQLEAELLTGRQINLERARAAALVGDMNTVMSEMTKEAGDYSQFMKYNVITQNSLAKAFGYTRDEMSDMLFQQKALTGLRKAGNNEEQKSLTERYNALVKLGKAGDDLTQLLGADVERTLAQQSAQEKFNKVIEKLEDIVGRLFDGGLLQKVAVGLASFAEHLTSGGSLFGILTNSSAYQAAQSRVQSQLGSVQDGVISPKGAIMISTPRGQIATDPGDSIIATSNPGSLLNGGNSSSNKGVEAKLDQLIALFSKGGNVYLDGKKVGTTLALGYNATL